MTDRLDPRDLFRGQWKTLTFRTASASHADMVARGLVYVVPATVGVVAGFSGFTLNSPDGILAGLALLVGGLLAVFTQLAAWRERLTQRESAYELSEASDREGVDEAVTHVLAASLWAVVGTIVVVIGQGFSDKPDGAIVGWPCAVIVGIGVHIALLFAMVVFRLYDTYLHVNRVPDRINGSVKD